MELYTQNFRRQQQLVILLLIISNIPIMIMLFTFQSQWMLLSTVVLLLEEITN